MTNKSERFCLMATYNWINQRVAGSCYSEDMPESDISWVAKGGIMTHQGRCWSLRERRVRKAAQCPSQTAQFQPQYI